jgi:hypothetical protein
MTTDVIKTDEYGNVNTDAMPEDIDATRIDGLDITDEEIADSMNALDEELAVDSAAMASEVDEVLSEPQTAIVYTAPEPEEGSWQYVQMKVNQFLTDLPDNLAKFFRNNQQPLTSLGLILLTIVGARILFAVLHAVTEIPFMASILQLIGFIYVARFVWRYLMRASDRQELAHKIENFKTDLLGSHT